MSSEAYSGWAIAELMGHRRIAGQVSEAEMFGAKLLRVEVPEVDGQKGFTQFFGGGSIYCLTPTTEEVARAFVRAQRPVAVQRYELALPPAETPPRDAELADGDAGDEEDQATGENGGPAW